MKNKQRAGARTAKREYLLSGLVFCGECGSAMHGTTTTARNKFVNVYYRCGNKNRRGTDACPNKYVSAPDLESLVLRKLSELIEKPAALDRIVNKVSAAYNQLADKKTGEKKLLTDKQTTLKKSMDNLYTLIEDGTADSFDFDRLKKVKRDLLAVQASLAEINDEAAPTISPEQIRDYINKIYMPAIKNKSAADLRAILEAFIDKIIIDRKVITIRYKVDLYWCAWSDSNTRPTA